MKQVHLIFSGNPDVYKELLTAFDLSFQELGYKTIVVSLAKKHIKHAYTTTGDFNVVVDAFNTIRPNNKHNVILHLENNARNDYIAWSKVLHISPLKICKNSVYFPFGYSRAFDYQYDVSTCKEDIDVSFLGVLTRTRHDFIKSLTGKYKIVVLNYSSKHISVERRDIGIAKSKVNLTMKSAPNCVFEQARASLILSKGKLLFAEENYKGGYGYMENFLVPFNKNTFDGLVDKYMDDKIRKEFTDYVRNETRTKHTFTRYVKEIIL